MVLRRFYRCAEDVLFPDVVNTASRLQAHAKGGEVLLSHRVVEALPELVGSRVELELKGKRKPEIAYCLSL